LTGKDEDKSKTHTKELEALKKEISLLKETLQLQRTNWLYSHHLSLSICFGAIYGVVIGTLVYFIGCQKLYLDIPGLFLSLFTILGIPVIAILPPIPLLKAPKFAFNSLRSYSVSFFLYITFIGYIDPLTGWARQYQGVERLSSILSVTMVQWLIVTLFVLFVPQIAKHCGYRLVLNGSTFTFEADADVVTVMEQLKRLEEDFNVELDRSIKALDRLYFTRHYEKEKTVLQFFLRQRESKTDVVLVMHSIRNDIPMKTEYEKLKKIGKSVITWLETSNVRGVRENPNESFAADTLQESDKSFKRQAFAFPSKKTFSAFFHEHWKDILVIISVAIAVLSWIFPFR